MYADKITDSMKRTIEETNRRRDKQIAYNLAHGITPKTVKKNTDEILKQTTVANNRDGAQEMKYYVEPEEINAAADPIVKYMSKEQLKKATEETQKRMQKAAKNLDFMEAARLRDELFALQKQLE
jgi:excinuclease ABC subunit B